MSECVWIDIVTRNPTCKRKLRERGIPAWAMEADGKRHRGTERSRDQGTNNCRERKMGNLADLYPSCSHEAWLYSFIVNFHEAPPLFLYVYFIWVSVSYNQTCLKIVPCLFFFFFFLGPHLWCTEVPRPEGELELPPPQPQPRPLGIQAMSGIYPTSQGNARSLTHWASPEN